MAKEKPLSPKALRFCWEWPIDCNNTQAAIRAGYAEKYADRIGYKLMQDPRVKAEIAKVQAQVAERAGLSAVMMASELKKIALADMTDYVEWGPYGVRMLQSDDVDGRVVAEVSETVTEAGGSKRIKLHDKMGAIAQINKMMGWNAPEKQELSGPGGGPLKVEEVSDAKQRLARLASRLNRGRDPGGDRAGGADGQGS